MATFTTWAAIWMISPQAKKRSFERYGANML
jgi:hypothetical protein